jgi:hypothetical protein
MAIVIGIDPGGRYTGVSVRNGDEVLLSSTYVRPETTPIVTWAVNVADMIIADVIDKFPDARIGIEGISDPKGFSGGKKAPINPKYIIHAATVLGAIAAKLPNAVIIKPGKNGSGEIYPDVLNGRRPKDLPGISDGATTRNHERSAFDVAGEVEGYIRYGYRLDDIV